MKIIFTESDKLKEFHRNLKNYFETTDHIQRATLRRNINNYIKNTIISTLDAHIHGELANISSIQRSKNLTKKQEKYIEISNGKITKLKVSIDKISKMELPNSMFFLWHTYFHDVFSRPSKEGFDIVIGNPPYIDSETMSNLGLRWERKLLQNKYSNLSGNWDVYMAFFELALSIGNIVSFITPDKWLSKPFGEKFRKNQMCTRVSTITRAGSKVFERATVDSIITLFTKNSETIDTARFVNKNTISPIISEYLFNLEPPFLIDYLFSNHSKLIQKIDLVRGKVSDYAECENACATSDFYIVKELIEENPSPDFKEYYKLINTGTIEKYRNKWADKEISYGGKYRFPVVKREIFNKTLGKTYVKRAASKKIIFKGLNLLDGCLDDQANILPGKSTIVICNEDINKLKFLLGVLNSPLSIFYIKTKYASSSYCGGITFSKNMINHFPLFATKTQQENIIKNVDKILLAKKLNPNADITFWESEINHIVYSLYDLTTDEIMIVEGK